MCPIVFLLCDVSSQDIQFMGKSIENHVHLQCTFQKNLEDFLKS